MARKYHSPFAVDTKSVPTMTFLTPTCHRFGIHVVGLNRGKLRSHQIVFMLSTRIYFSPRFSLILTSESCIFLLRKQPQGLEGQNTEQLSKVGTHIDRAEVGSPCNADRSCSLSFSEDLALALRNTSNNKIGKTVPTVTSVEFTESLAPLGAATRREVSREQQTSRLEF